MGKLIAFGGVRMAKEMYVLLDSWGHGEYEDYESDSDVLGVFETKELAEEARKHVYDRTKELEPSFEADEEEEYSYSITELDRHGYEVDASHTLQILRYQLNQLALMI